MERGSNLRPRRRFSLVLCPSRSIDANRIPLERARTMRTLAISLVVVGFGGAARAAETGDVDGDGRLTLADVVHFSENGQPPPVERLGDPAVPLGEWAHERPFAEGSLDAIIDFACTGWNDWGNVTGAIYLEVLRRAVPNSMPHWWTDVWTAPRFEPPLDADPRCAVHIVDVEAPGGDDDNVRMTLRLIAFEPVRSFALILDSEDGLVRARQSPSRAQAWRAESWTSILTHRDDDVQHSQGMIEVSANPADYLITGGRYVIAYGLDAFGDVLERGEYDIVVDGRLPIGTSAGTYSLEVSAGSQVLFEDGGVASPELGAGGEIVVDENVRVGWDGGIPPIDLDRSGRAVRGEVAFRATGGEAFPGEEVAIRVQLRTEVPLNEIRYLLQWPKGLPECALGWFDATTALYINPDDGASYPAQDCSNAERPSTVCGEGAFGHPSRAEGQFVLVGGAPCGHESSYPERPLEYFRPLGEWIDLVEIRLRIPEWVAGGTELPLTFTPFDPGAPDPKTIFGDEARAAFAPYDGEFLCPDRFHRSTPNWSYDVSYEGGRILVLGDSPGGEPPDPMLGVRVVVGDAVASPGETVLVPVFASAEVEPRTFRVALDVDPAAVTIDEIEVDFTSHASGEIVPLRGQRDRTVQLRECVDNDGDGVPDARCTRGEPALVWVRDALGGDVLADFVVERGPDEPAEDWPGPELREIARLVVDVREDFQGDSIEIRPAPVEWQVGSVLDVAETGGFSLEFSEAGVLHEPFSPAVSVSAGTIRIVTRRLRRGDANADGRLDLSDAVTTLGLSLSRCPRACVPRRRRRGRLGRGHDHRRDLSPRFVVPRGGKTAATDARVRRGPDAGRAELHRSVSVTPGTECPAVDSGRGEIGWATAASSTSRRVLRPALYFAPSGTFTWRISRLRSSPELSSFSVTGSESTPPSGTLPPATQTIAFRIARRWESKAQFRCQCPPVNPTPRPPSSRSTAHMSVSTFPESLMMCGYGFGG